MFTSVFLHCSLVFVINPISVYFTLAFHTQTLAESITAAASRSTLLVRVLVMLLNTLPWVALHCMSVIAQSIRKSSPLGFVIVIRQLTVKVSSHMF